MPWSCRVWVRPSCAPEHGAAGTWCISWPLRSAHLLRGSCTGGRSVTCSMPPGFLKKPFMLICYYSVSCLVVVYAVKIFLLNLTKALLFFFSVNKPLTLGTGWKPGLAESLNQPTLAGKSQAQTRGQLNAEHYIHLMPLCFSLH